MRPHGQVSGRDVRAYAEALTPPAAPILAAHDREQYWRGRGEPAIRAEMAQRVARRLRRRRVP